MSTQIKQCKSKFNEKCLISGDKSLFHGLMCLNCYSLSRQQYSKNYYQNNKEACTARAQRWAHNNKERVGERRVERVQAQKAKCEAYESLMKSLENRNECKVNLNLENLSIARRCD